MRSGKEVKRLLVTVEAGGVVGVWLVFPERVVLLGIRQEILRTDLPWQWQPVGPTLADVQ